MSKNNVKANNEIKNDNNNEEIKLIEPNENKIEDNINLENELLSSIFKTDPIFEKKYQNEELNKFKDEILIYLSERNRQYISLIKKFQNKILEKEKEYSNQINSISQNFNSTLSFQASLKNKIEKMPNFEKFINKTNDQLITHEIRINNLSSDFIKATQKYDKIYLENMELPGYIGKYAKFKNCQIFFDYVIREIDKINLYKEKNSLDLKTYKEKLDGIIKSIHLLVKNNNDAQFNYIKQLNDKCFKDCKDMNDLLSNRVCDLRIENAKYSIDLVKKGDEMNREWKKILEIKENLLNLVHEKINNFKNIFHNNINSFNNFKKEFEEFKIQINEVLNYFKELKSENNNINSNINNNSCNNYTGCYISSALPIDKKNWKYFSKKFPKKSKSKTKKINDKKNIIKNTPSLNTNRNDDNNNDNIKSVEINNLESDIIKIEENNISNLKEKQIRKRNYNNNINNEKIITSVEKYSIDNIIKKNVFGFKESRNCKTVSKIEINSHSRINSIDLNKKEENKNKLNEEKEKEKEEKININKINISNIKCNDTQIVNIEPSNTNNNNTIVKLSENINEDKDKGKKILHEFKRSERPLLQQNKTLQSDDSENNNISNINSRNMITLNTTNDNFSFYSAKSVRNMNRIVFNDVISENKEHVIKELASELEQSTNKKDKLASNKKRIENNFKIICNKISPLKLNRIKDNKEALSSNENDINQNIINTLNIGEKIKINSIIKEKKDEKKLKNNNNMNENNISQNDFNILNKKIDLFDKKLVDLESLLKEKLIDILLQIDNLQNFCYNSMDKKKAINQKLNNMNNFLTTSLNNNLNTNSNIMNRSNSNDYIKHNLITHNSHDDYFINCHSNKIIAPIIEINPDNLQFSPSPSKVLTILTSKKNKEHNKKSRFRIGMASNFKDFKLFKRNENKENNININNLDQWDLSLYTLLGKNFNGVNKRINLTKLIKSEQTKNSNFSNNGGLLSNGNLETN